jgi:hypothetical protein
VWGLVVPSCEQTLALCVLRRSPYSMYTHVTTCVMARGVCFDVGKRWDEHGNRVYDLTVVILF